MRADLLTPAIIREEPSIVVIRTLAAKIPIFRFSGEYFGFIYENKFFDATSNYLGWLDEDGCVWYADGSFLGQLADNNYILKLKDAVDPAPGLTPPVPDSPIPPFPEPDRVARNFPSDCLDALKPFLNF